MSYLDRYNYITSNIFEEYNKSNCDILLSFQHVDILKPDVSGNLQDYKWLEEQLGFTPIWTIKLRQGLNLEEFRKTLGKPYFMNRRFIFIIDDSCVNVTYIDAMKWIKSNKRTSLDEFNIEPNTEHIFGLVEKPSVSSILKVMKNIN